MESVVFSLKKSVVFVKTSFSSGLPHDWNSFLPVEQPSAYNVVPCSLTFVLQLNPVSPNEEREYVVWRLQGNIARTILVLSHYLPFLYLFFVECPHEALGNLPSSPVEQWYHSSSRSFRL